MKCNVHIIITININDTFLIMMMVTRQKLGELKEAWQPCGTSLFTVSLDIIPMTNRWGWWWWRLTSPCWTSQVMLSCIGMWYGHWPLDSFQVVPSHWFMAQWPKMTSNYVCWGWKGKQLSKMQHVWEKHGTTGTKYVPPEIRQCPIANVETAGYLQKVSYFGESFAEACVHRYLSPGFFILGRGQFYLSGDAWHIFLLTNTSTNGWK